MSTREYAFARVPAQAPEKIAQTLSDLGSQGWRVVSHADDGDEYSFVLERESARTADAVARTVDKG